MEPLTLLLGLAAIVGTGSLTKAGENITDEATKHFFDFLKRKAPDSSTVKSLTLGQPIDYGQAYLELETISQDAEAINLLEAVKNQVKANPQLADKVQSELNGNKTQISTVVENYKGIVIKDEGSAIFNGPVIF
jgi:hypothetical protein